MIMECILIHFHPWMMIHQIEEIVSNKKLYQNYTLIQIFIKRQSTQQLLVIK
jgi:hypothetical protein